MGRPGEVLRNQRRLVAIYECLEPRKVGFVERLGPSDRHADAVQRHRVVAANAGQRVVWRPASAHIIFRMDLKETTLRFVGEDRWQMLMFQAGACEACDGMGRKA